MKTFFDSLRRINNNWFALVGVVLIVCSLNAQNAYALANGQRGFADLNGNSNWWEWFVNEPESPNTGGKNLNLTLYLTDPTQNFTNENRKISIWGDCPDGTNQLLYKSGYSLQGPYGNQTGRFFHPFIPGWKEGTNLDLYAKLYVNGTEVWDEGAGHWPYIEKLNTNEFPWEITWTEYPWGDEVEPSQSTIHGMVIPSHLYSRFSADITHKIGSSSLVQFSSKVTGTNTASVYYRWDFDNNGIIDWEGIDESSPLYNYTSTGDYSVALSVSNSVGEVHSTLKVDYIQLLPSVVAEFSADVRTGGAPFSVQFTDLSENNPQFWSYDFDGDGTIDSTLQNPSHIYNSAGNYTVILTVSNNFGAENTSSDTVTKVDYIIVEPALVADFTVDKPAAAIGENVQFFDSSENSPEFWFWDFDNDGVTDSTLENPVTSFGTTGKKTVSLKVSNSWSSAEITKSKIVKIFGSSPNHYVFIGGSATSPYTSWSTAAHDIQSAITASEPFDSIYISNGNYSSAGYIKEGTNAILIETEIELIGCGKNVKIDGSGKMRGGYVSSGKVENITFENGAVFGSATAGRGGGSFLH